MVLDYLTECYSPIDSFANYSFKNLKTNFFQKPIISFIKDFNLLVKREQMTRGNLAESKHC